MASVCLQGLHTSGEKKLCVSVDPASGTDCNPQQLKAVGVVNWRQQQQQPAAAHAPPCSCAGPNHAQASLSTCPPATGFRHLAVCCRCTERMKCVAVQLKGAGIQVQIKQGALHDGSYGAASAVWSRSHRRSASPRLATSDAPHHLQRQQRKGSAAPGRSAGSRRAAQAPTAPATAPCARARQAQRRRQRQQLACHPAGGGAAAASPSPAQPSPAAPCTSRSPGQRRRRGRQRPPRRPGPRRAPRAGPAGPPTAAARPSTPGCSRRTSSPAGRRWRGTS